MTEIKPKWKKCPSCKGFIPETWMEHKKCGWNQPTKEEIIPVEKVEERIVTVPMSNKTMIMAYCKDLIVAGKMDLSAFESVYARLLRLLQ